MLINVELLQNSIPIFQNSKCIFYRLKNEKQYIFVKYLKSTEPKWKKYFLTEVDFYNLYDHNLFKKFQIPKLIQSDFENGILALEYLDGAPLTETRFIDQNLLSLDSLDRCIEIAIEISNLPIQINFVNSKQDYKSSLFSIIETSDQFGLKEKEQAYFIDLLKNDKLSTGFSNGDFLLRNIIQSHGHLYVCDWEFAGERLKYFDLAMLWVQLIKRPELQKHLYNKISANIDWTFLELIIVLILLKEIRIHKEDQLDGDVIYLKNTLRDFLNSMSFN